MKIAKNITELVGNTPLVYLNKVAEGAKIAAKLEFYNPLSSVKDRVGVAMIEGAEGRGLIAPGREIVEATSGNTGIGLSFTGAVKGYPVTIFMPENFSPERRKIMIALGAKVITTSKEEGMEGAVNAAEKYCREHKNAYMARQFENPDNPRIHRETTGPEIWRDTDGQTDIFVAGVGTGGTLTGAGEFLKSQNPNIKIVAVEPYSSAILSGGPKGPHAIQGIGAGFIPTVLNTQIYDEVIKIKDRDVAIMKERLATEEGIFAGPSAAAAAFAAVEIGKREENKNKLIITIFPDSGDRYVQ